MCLALAIIGTSSQADATDAHAQAKTAFETSRYGDAAKIWLESAPYQSLSPDVLYNIGNACYRGNSPGQAALFYRRALAINPHHEEARQNLRFIERKYGSITIKRPALQNTLARIPLSTWKNSLWFALWLCTIALITIAATRRTSAARNFAVITLVIAPALAFCAAFAWRAYPKDGEFAPTKDQAVIINEKAKLHSEASRTSAEVIDAPPGSLCTILHQTGRWSYVRFATQTRGWIPSDSIEKVVPDAPPKAPEFRKPKATDKSA